MCVHGRCMCCFFATVFMCTLLGFPCRLFAFHNPMESHGTAYDVLGVTPTATQSEIKTAFRTLAMHWHPDKNPDPEACTKFQKLNEAYQQIGTPNTRRRYDEEDHSVQDAAGPDGEPAANEWVYTEDWWSWYAPCVLDILLRVLQGLLFFVLLQGVLWLLFLFHLQVGGGGPTVGG